MLLPSAMKLHPSLMKYLGRIILSQQAVALMQEADCGSLELCMCTNLGASGSDEGQCAFITATVLDSVNKPPPAPGELGAFNVVKRPGSNWSKQLPQYNVLQWR